jgi:hypothetical protein
MIEDRSIAVPPGHIVKTGYVSVWNVEFSCRDRMSVGDVDRAFQKRLQLGDHQPWPPPRGHWHLNNRFIIEDGRHEYLAALMLGIEYLLVAWTEKAE